MKKREELEGYWIRTYTRPTHLTPNYLFSYFDNNLECLYEPEEQRDIRGTLWGFDDKFPRDSSGIKDRKLEDWEVIKYKMLGYI